MMSENLEWVVTYDEKCEQIRQYLKEQGCKKSGLYFTRKCFNNLKQYLIEKGIPYSAEAANEWISSLDTVENYFTISLARLSDLYTFGTISPINEYPRLLHAYDGLNSNWKQMTEVYFCNERSATPKSVVKEVRNSIAHFLYALQKKGVQDLSSVTYQILKEVCDYEKKCHTSEKIQKRYINEPAMFFEYYASCGKCQHGFSLYIRYKSWDTDDIYENLSDEQQIVLDKYREESLDFPAEEFYALIKPFCEKYVNMQYNKNVPSEICLFLQRCCMFFELHNVGYHPEIARIFLEKCRPLYSDSVSACHYRALFFFNEYTEQGDFRIRKLRYTPLAMDLLPDWCKNEMTSFFQSWNKAYPWSSGENNHRSSITRFCKYLVNNNISSFSEITVDILRDFNLNDIHESASGKNSTNSSVRTFLKYLEDKHMVKPNIYKILLGTAVEPKKIPDILSDDEIDIIHKFASAAKSELELRDTAIMAVALEMGVRESDIVALNLDSIDWFSSTITFIQVKTDVKVTLPMPVSVGNKIYAYLKFGRHYTTCKALFIKTHAPYDRLSNVVCNNIIERILPERNVPRSGFHVTRRTFASEKMKARVEPEKIASLLGQQSTGSLDSYLSYDEETMRKCALGLEERGINLPEGFYD